MRRGPIAAGLVVSVVCAAAFWELAEDFAYSPAVMHFDAVVADAVQSWREPWLDVVMRTVTYTGGVVFVLFATALVTSALWLRGLRGRAITLSALVAVGALLSTIAKGHFSRPRPPAADALVALPVSYSFPSGHTMASLCFGTALAYLALRSRMRRWAKAASVAAAALYAFAVAVSRVYLGVHWPSDVVASWFLGGAWLALALGAIEAYRPSREDGTAAEELV